MTPPDLHRRVAARTQLLTAELVGLSHRIHATAELGFDEHESVAAVVHLLAAHGITASVGTGGLDTAFHVTAGHGAPSSAAAPHVGLFAEYDALPDIGHGCGHNIVCAAAVGAFLVAAQELPALGGSITLSGTPAQENGSGKELLARAGAFDDLHAALMLHPAGGETAVDVTSHALRTVEATYHGVPAHTAGSPHEGRSALDAVVAAYQGIAALRQHIRDGERVHGIILEGGRAATVVPTLAKARFLLRSPDTDALAELSRRVQDVLDGAALITETRLEAHWDQAPPCLPMRSNGPLAARFAEHYAGRGNSVGPGRIFAESTDLGNVSVRIPAIHPMIGIAPAETPPHTAAFADAAISPAADRAVIDGAAALALTALDYLSDPALRAACADQFAAQGGYLDVPNLLLPPASR